MTRKIIATVLAAALSLTSVNVTAAQAGDRDAVRIIVGATALAIIGTALAAEQRKKQNVTRNHQPQHSYNQGRHQNNYQRNHYKPHHQKPKAQHRRVSVPRNCLMAVKGHRGWTEGYAVRCAQRNTRATLPSDCVRRNFAQGPRLFYAPQCLRRNGFNA